MADKTEVHTSEGGQPETDQPDTVRLKHLAGVNPKKSEISDLPADTDVTFVPLEGFGTNGDIEESEVTSLEEVYQGYTYFREGDIAIAKITPSFENGKGAICEGLENGIGFGTTELHILRPRQGTNPKFLWYVLRAKPFMDEAETAMHGVAGQKRVQSEFLETYRVPKHPPERQQVIADFLDRRTARIDALVAKQKRLLDLLDEKRQSFITQAVTAGLDSSVATKNTKVEWLGEIPKKWDISPLKYQLSVESGMTPTKSESRFWDGQIPWFTAKDMKSEELKNSIDCITTEAIDESQISLLPPETVIIVTRGMILAHSFPVGLTKSRATVNQDMKALIPNDGLTPKFLQRLLQGLSPAILALVDESSHGTKRLDTGQLGGLEIPVPPLEVQEQILDDLAPQLKRIDTLIEKIENSIELLDEKRQALITAAVTGQIDGIEGRGEIQDQPI